MIESLGLITVNKKQDYHNCEMVFSLYYNHAKSDFKVEKDQKYKIHTTIKEVEVLNEALNVYQAEGFKDAYLLFAAEVDGSAKYPDFVPRLNTAQALGKQLQALSNDEDSLVQLSEYCIEIIPTYNDDFEINKHIESITINGITREINGYDDLREYISKL
ncbi:MAG TPA: hypothetical protein PLM93_06590 [Sulfuricurvum sp.]|nr:MAG: hypothetical protein B7Y30_04795 [Campylobacterales bacterium 16-40-21]OZA01850.1 MAG: hypothetical protein B7X89_11790 [Sulfuricurvum sp. 17-40-25]HQS66834.1 hypothetical protein [Sulfuricurvum sp.]HQT36037.1 hypothetical protein [Sulfuricurvum sp.]